MKFIYAFLVLVLNNMLVLAQGTLNNSFDGESKNGVICYNVEGNELFIAGGNSLVRYSIESSERLAKEKMPLSDIRQMTISPSGSELAVSNESRTIQLVDSKTLQAKQKLLLPKGVGTVVEQTYLNDSVMVVRTDKNQIVSLQTRNNAINWTINLKKELPLRAFFVSAEAALVVTGGGSKTLKLWDATTGALKHTFAKEESWIRASTIDLDGKYVAVGMDNGRIRVYQLSDYEQMYSYQVHEDWVSHIEFSPSTKYLISSSYDRTSVFYDLKEKKTAQVISGIPYETTSFQMSPDGKDIIFQSKYTKSNPAYTVASLGILPRKILKDNSDKMPPQIYVSEPARIVQNKAVVSVNLLALKGSVVDESGVHTLRINGVDVPFKQNGNFVMYVPLTMGDNAITIEAIDINDNIALRKFTIVRKSLEGIAVDTAAAKNYLLVIGIDQYKFWPALNNAVSDSKMVGSTLLSNYTFEPEDATFLFDTAATKSNIDKVLRQYIELCGPNDNLMIYYAGHGYFDEVLSEGYWVPYNAQLGDESQYISNTRILKIINNIPSKHTFLVVDACFSGSLFADRERGYTDNVERYKSRWGLASGRLEKVSDGALGDHSPFATSFVECLRSLEGKELSASEVAQYVKQKVSEATNQTPRGNPLKNVGDEGGEFIFHKKL